MRFKVVPDPVDRDLLLEVHEALPLVPGSVEDCCARIRDRTTIPSRDEARAWLTFAQALGLAVETERGYHRPRDPPAEEKLARAFRERVFPVRELLGALSDADDSLTAGEAFETVREAVPRWERSRHADWEREWTERVARLLDWAAAFGSVEQTDGGYAPSE